MLEDRSRTQLVTEIARCLQPRVYLELGTWLNETLSAVAAACPCCRCYGVDLEPVALRMLPNISLEASTTQEYLTQRVAEIAPVDLAYIDAAHDYASVRSDFDLLWPHIAPNGVVLLDDTWPGDVEHTNPEYSGDAWKITDDFLDERLMSVTLPFVPGLTIVVKLGPRGWI